MWTLPGGGVDYGEQPVEALVREIGEETDLAVLGTPELLHARSFVREGPYMGVQLIYAVTLEDGVPRVVDVGGSTLRSAWVALAEVETMPVVDLVRFALNLRANRRNDA
jgi:8-oxo-dGTP diphosphatase